MRLTDEREIPARSATVSMEMPSSSLRFWRMRTACNPMDLADFATFGPYAVNELTWNVTIVNVSTIENLLHMFLKRLGPDPHLNGAQTPGCYGCPDIWELENGDFAVIGADITNLTPQLPPSANCGPDERMVRIPRKTLLLAKQDIPDSI